MADIGALWHRFSQRTVTRLADTVFVSVLTTHESKAHFQLLANQVFVRLPHHRELLSLLIHVVLTLQDVQVTLTTRTTVSAGLFITNGKVQIAS